MCIYLCGDASFCGIRLQCLFFQFVLLLLLSSKPFIFRHYLLSSGRCGANWNPQMLVRDKRALHSVHKAKRLGRERIHSSYFLGKGLDPAPLNQIALLCIARQRSVNQRISVEFLYLIVLACLPYATNFLFSPAIWRQKTTCMHIDNRGNQHYPHFGANRFQQELRRSRHDQIPAFNFSHQRRLKFSAMIFPKGLDVVFNRRACPKKREEILFHGRSSFTPRNKL